MNKTIAILGAMFFSVGGAVTILDSGYYYWRENYGFYVVLGLGLGIIQLLIATWFSRKIPKNSIGVN